MKELLQSFLPHSLYRALVAPYHFVLAFFSALRYGFPGKKLTVVLVTGTKGKSTVTEMVAAVLTEAGQKVAVSSTIHFRIGANSVPNLYKMTLPGRGFIQKFLHDAVTAACNVAVIEVTSEAALQSRHLFLFPNALVFTNLQKEHLESHGGMENYFRAKLRIGKEVASSVKRPRIIVANADDEYGRRFLELPVEKRVPFSLNDAHDRHTDARGVSFTVDGVSFTVPHPGEMSMVNALASARAGEALGIPLTTAARALSTLTHIAGRTERIDAGQSFTAVVDNAHTPDSLKALYAAYPGRKICVLGNMGGGRDQWKRPLMGSIADESCVDVILTNEDPCDEDPRAIVDAMAEGMKRAPTIIMDRREAIREALSRAKPDDTVLVSGKGTDPFIMQAHGAKTPWSDAQVVREELEKRMN